MNHRIASFHPNQKNFIQSIKSLLWKNIQKENITKQQEREREKRKRERERERKGEK
jgi:hypothetical protein